MQRTVIDSPQQFNFETLVSAARSEPWVVLCKILRWSWGSASALGRPLQYIAPTLQDNQPGEQCRQTTGGQESRYCFKKLTWRHAESKTKDWGENTFWQWHSSSALQWQWHYCSGSRGKWLWGGGDWHLSLPLLQPTTIVNTEYNNNNNNNMRRKQLLSLAQEHKIHLVHKFHSFISFKSFTHVPGCPCLIIAPLPHELGHFTMRWRFIYSLKIFRNLKICHSSAQSDRLRVQNNNGTMVANLKHCDIKSYGKAEQCFLIESTDSTYGCNKLHWGWEQSTKL